MEEKEIKKDIEKIFKYFKIGSQSGIKVILTDKVQYAVVNYVIKVGKKMPKDNILLAIIHEILHTKGCLDHYSELSKALRYGSDTDKLSEMIAERIFKRKLRWKG